MEDKVLALKDGCVTFTEGFFDESTYMVEGKQTGEVSPTLLTQIDTRLNQLLNRYVILLDTKVEQSQ